MQPQLRMLRTDGNQQNLEEAQKDSSLEPLRRRRALKHLDFRFPASKTVGRLISVVLIRLTFGTLLHTASQKYLHKPSLCVWIKKYFIFIDTKYRDLHSHGKTQKDGCIFKLLPVVAWVEEVGGVEVREFTSLKIYFWIFLAVQGLRLCASNARGTGFISGREIKMPHAMWHGQKKLKKKVYFQKSKSYVFFFGLHICFMYFPNKNVFGGNSLVVQWLGLWAFTAEGPGSIPGWGTKILKAVKYGGGKKNRYVYMYNRIILLYTWNTTLLINYASNIVNQLCFN